MKTVIEMARAAGMTIKKVTPWVIVSPEGLYWVGQS